MEPTPFSCAAFPVSVGFRSSRVRIVSMPAAIDILYHNPKVLMDPYRPILGVCYQHLTDEIWGGILMRRKHQSTAV